MNISTSENMDSVGASVHLEKEVFFDKKVGQLVSKNAIVALNFQEVTLLQLLLTRRARKNIVIEEVWSANGTIVTEASYHQLVRSLRKKFEEIGLSAQSIKTLPRYGLEYLREEVVVVAVQAQAVETGDIKQPLGVTGGVTGDVTDSATDVTSPWLLLMLLLPLVICLYLSLMSYRSMPAPVVPIANQSGIHLFDIGGSQFDPVVLQAITKRSKQGEYVYMARNGPRVWLGLCATSAKKEFSFCRQDYLSLY